MSYPGRRPVTVRWTAATDEDEGDAAKVSAEIEAWLAGRPASGGEGGLGGLRDGLERLVRDPRIARDAVFGALLAELPARAGEAEGFYAALGALLARAEALAEAGPEAAPRARRMILRL